MLGLVGLITASICVSCAQQRPSVGPQLGVPRLTVDQQSSDGCALFQVRLDAGGSPIIEPISASGVSTYCAMNGLKLLSDTAGTFGQATGTLRLAVVMENMGSAAVIPRVKLRFNADSVIRLDSLGNPVSGTPDILGYQPDSASANGRNAYWFFDQSLAPSGQPQVLMPGARTQRRWLEFRGTGWTDRVRLKLFATGAEQAAVPAVPPDSQPAGLYHASNVVYDSAGPILKNTVMVTFHSAATQAQRQALIDSVGGTVIGGGQTSSTTGFYYVRVDAIQTLAELHVVVARLAGSPHVDAAAVVLALHIPAEAPIVPAVAPDYVPSGLFADSNLVADPDLPRVRYVKRLVSVLFKATATVVDRQAAIAVVGGVVIGGVRILGSDGYYLIRLVSDTSVRGPKKAAALLESLPAVDQAFVETVSARLMYLRPREGNDLSVPALAPDSIPTSLINSLELLTDAAGKQLRSELVVLQFHEGTSQAIRQAVISSVSGVVVGGQAGIQMEGWYLIRVVTATTVAAIDSVVDRLTMEPSVAVVGPFSVGLPNDQSWPKRFATRAETASVPAIAPDTLPPGLISSLPNITDSANRTIKSQIVMVKFREGTAQPLREAAVNAVSGQVIGGIRVPIGEGVYYLRITTASTASALHAAASILHALPQVAVVYLLDAVPMDQQSSAGCARVQVRLDHGGSPIIEPIYASGVSSYCAVYGLKLVSWLWTDRVRLKLIATGAESPPVRTVAPDSVPFSAISRLFHPPNGGWAYSQDVLMVRFRLGTPVAERSRVLGIVSASVIGGKRDVTAEGGIYVIALPRDSTQATLSAARSILGAEKAVLSVWLYEFMPHGPTSRVGSPDESNGTPLNRVRALIQSLVALQMKGAPAA